MRHTSRAVITRELDVVSDLLLEAYEQRDQLGRDSHVETDHIRYLKSVRSGLSYFGVAKQSAYKRHLSSRTQRRVLNRLLDELAIEIQRRRNKGMTSEGYGTLDDAYRFLSEELDKLTKQKQDGTVPAHEIVPGMPRPKPA